MNACTTNPPPKESIANRLARRSTIGRDLDSPDRVSPAPGGASTAGDNDRATIAPPIAAGTNTKNHVASEGASLHAELTTDGSAAASAPTAPAAVATAL